jgi:hypothetical protein
MPSNSSIDTNEILAAIRRGRERMPREAVALTGDDAPRPIAIEIGDDTPISEKQQDHLAKLMRERRVPDHLAEKVTRDINTLTQGDYYQLAQQMISCPHRPKKKKPGFVAVQSNITNTFGIGAYVTTPHGGWTAPNETVYDFVEHEISVDDDF